MFGRAAGLSIFLILLGCRTPAPVKPAVAVRAPVAAKGDASDRVQKLKITVLSTMLADKGIGEWGFAAVGSSFELGAGISPGALAH